MNLLGAMRVDVVRRSFAEMRQFSPEMAQTVADGAARCADWRRAVRAEVQVHSGFKAVADLLNRLNQIGE